MNRFLAICFSILSVGVAFGRLIPTDYSQNRERESSYYEIESVPIPDPIALEVTGLARVSPSRIAILTRRGEVWLADHIDARSLSKVAWKRFAFGLHEPIGLSFRDGWFYVTQRSELTRLRDSDGDDQADVFETLCDDWGMSGDYHEFACGSPIGPDGNVWLTLCLTGSVSSEAFLRGWAVKVDTNGRMTPVANGIRSPGGMGANQKGDVFYSENQGFWNGSSSLKHLRQGSFQGSPEGNKWIQEVGSGFGNGVELPDVSTNEALRALVPDFVPPAIVFPHGKMGQSPTGIIWDSSDGSFGPFEGQMLVGDYTHSLVHRVFLEKVNGVYQGACFPFLSGFGSGVMSLDIAEDGYLFVGGLNRGWPSLGEKPFALERVRWSGKKPFEIRALRATPEGFELEFTKPVDPELASNPDTYQLAAWTYFHRKLYGSPEIQRSAPKARSVVVSEDGLTARLEVEGRVKGHVHELFVPALVSESGESLVHPLSYYTLNEIPES